jgi:hypothetical protein
MKNTYGTSLLVATVLATGGVTTMAMAQDECSTAVGAVIGANAFNTASATTSPEAVSDTQCAATYLSWGTANKDVWFTWTATADGLLSLNTCLAGSFDTSMVLYTGTCGALTQVACNGDGAGLAGCQTFYSNIAGFNVLGGTTYYIRIGGYTPASGISESGAGQLNLAFQAVAAGCAGSTGPCGSAHAGTGCSDAVCCSAVCAINDSCCSIQWDADCVTIAVDACGIYQCSPVAGAPANDCATNATVISGTTNSQFNFNTATATTDGPDHPGATCNSGSDIFDQDIWYRVTPAYNGQFIASTCGTVSYDNKLAIYDLGTDPASFDYNNLPEALLACNDDGASGTCNTTTGTTYASELPVTVAAGRTYLVRMGSFTAGETGTGTIRFTVPEACALDAGTSTEVETCGSATNNGCNAAGEFGSLAVGGTVTGTFWADADTRDTDFYQFFLTAPAQVTLEGKSASLSTVLILKGDISVAACAGVQVVATGSGACPNTATYCLGAGTYYAFIAPAAFTGIPCGTGVANNYSLKLTATPATCPLLLSGGWDGTAVQPGVCDNPGPNTVVTSTAAAGGGLVACAVGPAFPACNTGGTTVNSYARSINAGLVAGSISCIDIGVFSVARDVNAANTACANYISDIPLPATVGVYADLDGGAPRFKTADDGVDGGDLKLLFKRDVFINGGAYVATWNLENEECVQDFADKNLVVIMDCPDLFTGTDTVPGASGYGIRAGGGTVAGQTSNTYVRLSCADGAGQYVLAETVGATFTAQWIVNVKGDFSGCGAACPGDFDGDGFITAADLSTLLGSWGGPGGDIDGDGTTTAADLSALLGAWGACQ